MRHTSLKHDTLLKITYIKYEYNVHTPYTFLSACPRIFKKELSVQCRIQLCYFSARKYFRLPEWGGGGVTTFYEISTQGSDVKERSEKIVLFILVLSLKF